MTVAGREPLAPAKGKVFVLGLDGVPWELLHSLVDRGYLKVFSSLMGVSTRATLRSTLPPVTGPAWTSFATGVNPGKHGVYGLFHYDAGFRPRPVNSTDIKVPTLPEILSERGLRSIFINLPVSYPPRDFNGIMVADFLAPRPYIYPQGLSAYLDGYRIFFDHDLKGLDRVEDVIDVERRRVGLARRLMVEQQWDLFFVLISGTDWVSHACYHQLMEGGALGERALGLFEEVDAYLGWLLSNLPQGAVLMLLSDHGFQHATRVLDLNSWLRSRRLAARRVKERDYVGHRMREDGPPRRDLRLPPRLVDVVERYPRLKAAGMRILRGRAGSDTRLRTPYTVDVPNSLAFAINEIPYEIYVNHEAVESDGDYQRLVGRIISELRGLEDPISRAPAFDLVLSKAEAYAGPQVAEAPDIVCIPRPGLHLDRSFLNEGRFTPARVNCHSLDGFFMVHGPGFDSNRDIGRLHIWDVTPTILNLLGVVVPEGMDGQPLRPGAPFSEMVASGGPNAPGG